MPITTSGFSYRVDPSALKRGDIVLVNPGTLNMWGLVCGGADDPESKLRIAPMSGGPADFDVTSSYGIGSLSRVDVDAVARPIAGMAAPSERPSRGLIVDGAAKTFLFVRPPLSASTTFIELSTGLIATPAEERVTYLYWELVYVSLNQVRALFTVDGRAPLAGDA